MIFFDAVTCTGSDFVAVDKQLTLNGTHQKIEVEIPIVDDTMFEQDEIFQAHLQLISSNVNATVEPTPATVTIEGVLQVKCSSTLAISTMQVNFSSLPSSPFLSLSLPLPLLSLKY